MPPSFCRKGRFILERIVIGGCVSKSGGSVIAHTLTEFLFPGLRGVTTHVDGDFDGGLRLRVVQGFFEVDNIPNL